jgi:uncharacterized protein YggT (Ycf19 family)
MTEHESHRTTTVRKSVHPGSSQVVEQHYVENDVTNPRSSAERVVYYILNLVEILLVLRLIFRLLGANPNNGLVNFLYTLTAPLVAPFVGIFRQPVVSGSVLEWSTVIAMIIYALVAYLIVHFIRLSTRRTVS